MIRIGGASNCSGNDVLEPIMKFQCTLHTENTRNGGLDGIQIRSLDKAVKVDPEFGYIANSTHCYRTFFCHSKNRVAGNMSTARIEVGDEDFAGMNGFLDASDGTINGIIVEPV
jgi:hypothetical protein